MFRCKREKIYVLPPLHTQRETKKSSFLAINCVPPDSSFLEFSFLILFFCLSILIFVVVFVVMCFLFLCWLLFQLLSLICKTCFCNTELGKCTRKTRVEGPLPIRL